MHAAFSLREVQRRFMAALYDDGAAAGSVAAIAGDGLEPEARLRIYRRSCNETQTAALRATYPAVLALVGEVWFDQTAQVYRRSHPSVSGNLQVFGEAFAEYLETLPKRRTLAYLADVAGLEWRRQKTVLAAEAKTVSAENFSVSVRVAHQAPGVVLHPSVHLFASRYPVLTIWRYAMQPTSGRLTLGGEGENVVLWREDGEVAMAAVDAASFACIAALVRGCPLGEADAVALAVDPQFDPLPCVESLLERRLVTGIRPLVSRSEVSPP